MERCMATNIPFGRNSLSPVKSAGDSQRSQQSASRCPKKEGLLQASWLRQPPGLTLTTVLSMPTVGKTPSGPC